MTPAKKALRNVQIGRELTGAGGANGTPVAATHKLVANATLRQLLEREYDDDYPRQVFAPYSAGGVDQQTGSELEVEQNMTYEDLLFVLSAGLGAAGSPGGVGPYTYTFARAISGPAAPEALTVEGVEDDGSTKHIEKEFAHGIVRSFEIVIARGQPAKLSYEIFGRAATDNTVTPALSAVAGRQVIASNLFKLEIDDTWAALGSTQLSGLMRSATLRVTTGLEPDYTLDARATLDFTQLLHDEMDIELDIVAEFDANAALELADWEAGTQRFVRLSAAQGAGGQAKSVQFDLACVYRDEAPTPEDEDGIRVVTLNLKGDYDPVAAKYFEPVVSVATILLDT